MDNISKILLTSSKMIIDNLSLDKKNPLPFKMDELIQATVLKVFSNRNATLSIEGKKITVKTGIPLKEGEEIFLKAEKTGDQVALKLVDKEEQPSGLGQRFLKNLDRAGPYKHIENLIREFGSAKSGSANQSPAQSETLPRTLKFISHQLEKIAGKSPQLKAEYQNILEKVAVNRNLSTELKLSALLATAKEMFRPESTAPETIKAFVLKTADMVVKNNEISPAILPEPVYDKTLKNNTSKLFSEKSEDNLFRKLIDFQRKIPGEVSPNEKKSLDFFTHKSLLKFEHKLLAVLVNDEKFISSNKFSGVDIEEVLLNLLKEIDEEAEANIKTIRFLSNEKAEKIVVSGARSDRANFDIKDIERLVKEISLKSGDPDKNIVKSFIKSSGLKWENTIVNLLSQGEILTKKSIEGMILKDLKGLAMSLLASTDSGDEDVTYLIRNFVDTLEQMQVINSYSSEESGRYLLPLPAMFDDTFTFGQLLIDLGGGKKNEKDPKDRLIRVAFILEMSELGDLRADFSILKKAISGAFGVGSQEFCNFIKGGLPGLKVKLNDHGYAVHTIDCQVIDPELLSNTSLADNLIQEEKEGILNLVI